MGRGIMLEDFTRVDLEWIRSNIDYSTNSFTDPNGMYVVLNTMPEEIAYTHKLDSFGIPARISVYNPADLRKFKIDTATHKLLQNDDGEQGLIGYLDFYKEHKDDQVNSKVGFMYIYPEYRGKGLTREVTDFLEILTPPGSVIKVGTSKDETIFYMAKQWNDLHPGRVDYK
jgi:hypothetical protein